MNAVHIFLSAILVEEFATMITEKWVERMQRCMAADERYFEKEMVQSDSK